jgi:hypothetical protein
MSYGSKVTFFLAIAISALTLFPPSVVAGAEFRAAAPVYMSGGPIGADSFVVGGIDVACDDADFSGRLSGSSKTLEIEPEFYDCRGQALSGFRADFFQEVCAFRLHGLKPVGQTSRWKADVDLKCGGEFVGIGWDFFETEAKYAEVESVCFFRILQQPDIGTAELRNLGARGLEVKWNLDRFEYSMSLENEPTSSLLCGSSLGGVEDDAYYRGTTIVVPKDPRGRPTAISLGA